MILVERCTIIDEFQSDCIFVISEATMFRISDMRLGILYLVLVLHFPSWIVVIHSDQC